MRVLIVDDERPARDKMRRLLEQEPGISAIEEARDGVEALERLPAFAPDLLLLDIQMPEITGLDVAASLPAPAPLVVFVTAYDEYAIRAFDANAIDYLLKPYDQQRLQRALQRVRERLAQQRAAQTIQPMPPLLTEEASPPLQHPLPAISQLLVPERGGTRIVRVEHIQWIETADNYVVLHTAEGQPLMRQTLAGLVDKLGPRFLRCHRRAAVQLDWIVSVQHLDKGDGELVLRSGARVPCSRQYRAEVMERLNGQ
ncbi:response regulator [Rugamonas sp. FT107W]|uniref:Response regulator n=1 Tax=Duganella vulcania TaxID=2692166 RepID=A0A845HK39_9BURK|nr:response regulator [Duganella vulcania]MYN17839.1 response regulator [Duganella vulcania]